MSDLPVDYVDRLNLREQIARIDRQREEAQKFAAEQHKLAAETARFRRGWFLGSILAAGALGGFIAAVVPLLLRSWCIR